MSRKVSIIVPCYNEEQTVQAVAERIRSVNFGFEYEIIVVDDGSTDRTSDLLKDLNGLLIVRHQKNKGKGAAILTGVEYATGAVVAIQDADLEYDPADIPALVNPILEGKCDVAYGSRFKGRITGMHFSHYIGNKILTYFTRLLYHTDLTDLMTGHKAFRTDVIRNLDLQYSRFEFELEATVNALEKGYSIMEVPITYSLRRFGKAKIQWRDGARCLFHLFRRRLQYLNGSTRGRADFKHGLVTRKESLSDARQV